MNIKLTKSEDIELVKQFAERKSLPYTKAVVEAIRIAENEVFLKGKIASLQYMYKLAVQQQFPIQKNAKKK